jgi:butyrate kinase
MSNKFRVFVVNPGSTSTKLGIYTSGGSEAEGTIPAQRVPGAPRYSLYRGAF